MSQARGSILSRRIMRFKQKASPIQNLDLVHKVIFTLSILVLFYLAFGNVIKFLINHKEKPKNTIKFVDFNIKC